MKSATRNDRGGHKSHWKNVKGGANSELRDRIKSRSDHEDSLSNWDGESRKKGVPLSLRTLHIAST